MASEHPTITQAHYAPCSMLRFLGILKPVYTIGTEMGKRVSINFQPLKVGLLYVAF